MAASLFFSLFHDKRVWTRFAVEALAVIVPGAHAFADLLDVFYFGFCQDVRSQHFIHGQTFFPFFVGVESDLYVSFANDPTYHFHGRKLGKNDHSRTLRALLTNFCELPPCEQRIFDNNYLLWNTDNLAARGCAFPC